MNLKDVFLFKSLKNLCHFFLINYLEFLKQQKDFCQFFPFITWDVTAH